MQGESCCEQGQDSDLDGCCSQVVSARLSITLTHNGILTYDNPEPKAQEPLSTPHPDPKTDAESPYTEPQ
jgi:hypothetical protein